MRRKCKAPQFPPVMIAFGAGLCAAMLLSPRFALFMAAVALIYYGVTSPRC
ncbi:MAG: hypothetical protein FWE19_08080 [Oscillospiraceae bacterium]|nr:hypothetical protein [Oscillospiraceae bacterium]